MNTYTTLIFQYYSSPLFYLTVGYICIISLLFHLAILHLCTQISVEKILKQMPYLFMFSFLVSLFTAPLVMIACYYVAQYFYSSFTTKDFQIIFFTSFATIIYTIIQQQLRTKFPELSNPKNQKYLTITGFLSVLFVVYSLKIIGLI